MKRYGNLWERIITWENLVLGARKAQRGKRDRLSVQSFNFNQERELLKVQRELRDGSYRPGQFRTHWVNHPKSRLISAAPYRDRVVHHALMNILEPILDLHFHSDSYACRKCKGTHAAANRLQKLMQKYRYALQCDIKKYFPSIDHEVLKQIFRRLIKDRNTLSLMDLIVDHSNKQPTEIFWFERDDLFTPLDRRTGLPIGNLTSQWFANWMLNDLDHRITSQLGIGGYVRYCDDFVLFHNDKKRLKSTVGEIGNILDGLRLRLHKNKASIRPVRAGLTFVGYRIWPNHRLLKKDNIRRFSRRLRWMKQAYAEGKLGWADVKLRLDSWLGHAKHADSKQIIKRLSKEWRFTRDGTKVASCYSRRGVEQQCDKLPDNEPEQQHAIESEQQQRIPSRPALSFESEYSARNCIVYGLCECGFESPGSIPVLRFPKFSGRSRIFVVKPDGAGRYRFERPIRLFFLLCRQIA